MREAIERFLNSYISEKQKPFSGSEFGNYVRNEIPRAFYDTGLVDSERYLISASVGQGNWAMVPLICIFDRSITMSAMKGVYIAYLLSGDGKTLYITFNQGCTDIRRSHSKKETIKIMRERVRDIASKLNPRYFSTDEGVDLGSNLTDLGEMYARGAIFYKAYHQGAVPDEQELRTDLKTMMEIYGEYTNIGKTIESEHKPGRYDSWTVIDDNTAEKVCDKSFFEHGGSGVPRAILWFFDAESLSNGESLSLSLTFENIPHTARLTKETRSAGRVRMFWDKALVNELSKYRNDMNITAVYRKTAPGSYTIEMRGEHMPEVQSIKEALENIKAYIASKGFTYSGELIENYYLSLKSKPFVILAGTSGTGKTRLVKLFAEAVGSTSAEGGGNGRYKLVPVRPDWSDSTDLFGHVNLKGKFVPGAIIDFIKQASEDLEHPYFLCMDEMNLARVEYYLSDFLSIIETRRKSENGIITDTILLDTASEKEYGKLILPENLYVIGTVNMDETTFPFSKKVLDRANTIEFSYVDLIPSFEDEAEAINPVPQGNGFMRAEYITLKSDIPAEYHEYVVQLCEELQDFNRILQKAQAHVGYRVRDEIVFYMINNKQAELLSDDAALDNEIMQKILPRIQGSSASVRDLLCDLFKKCAGDYTGLSQAAVSDQMQAYIDSKPCKYPNSAEKLCYMMRRFEQDGFTSYWL